MFQSQFIVVFVFTSCIPSFLAPRDANIRTLTYDYPFLGLFHSILVFFNYVQWLKIGSIESISVIWGCFALLIWFLSSDAAGVKLASQLLADNRTFQVSGSENFLHKMRKP